MPSTNGWLHPPGGCGQAAFCHRTHQKRVKMSKSAPIRSVGWKHFSPTQQAKVIRSSLAFHRCSNDNLIRAYSFDYLEGCFLRLSRNLIRTVASFLESNSTVGCPVVYYVTLIPRVTIGKNTCSRHAPSTHTVTSYVGQVYPASASLKPIQSSGGDCHSPISKRS